MIRRIFDVSLILSIFNDHTMNNKARAICRKYDFNVPKVTGDDIDDGDFDDS